jgi:DNA modification methylase
VIKIIQGDCLQTVKSLEDKSINTCVTSPPYWGLRDYDEDAQLGLEESPEEFVQNLVTLFSEIKRVLRDDGTVWLNLGDSYAGNNSRASNNGRAGYGTEREGVFNKTGQGLKNKDLVGIPFRVAFALQQDGWYLRQDIIWHKPNPMPESVTDRCTKAHEYIFLLTKSSKYYYDNEAIKEDSKYYGKDSRSDKGNIRYEGKRTEGADNLAQQSFVTIDEKKNKRSVWTVTTKPFKDAHFATFPMDLIKPCVLAGCPEKVCIICNQPYIRKVISKRVLRNELPVSDVRYRPNKYEGSYKDINGKADAGYTKTSDLGLEKQCDCDTNKTKRGVVLDPFGGSATTGILAEGNNRDSIMLELNPEYINIAKQRIQNEFGMFTKIEINKGETSDTTT